MGNFCPKRQQKERSIPLLPFAVFPLVFGLLPALLAAVDFVAVCGKKHLAAISTFFLRWCCFGRALCSGLFVLSSALLSVQGAILSRRTWSSVPLHENVIAALAALISTEKVPAAHTRVGAFHSASPLKGKRLVRTVYESKVLRRSSR